VSATSLICFSFQSSAYPEEVRSPASVSQNLVPHPLTFLFSSVQPLGLAEEAQLPYGAFVHTGFNGFFPVTAGIEEPLHVRPYSHKGRR
jgi:hypothetical protein